MKEKLEEELKKAEEQLAKEVNLNKISFYEGYIKGLKILERNELAVFDRLKTLEDKVKFIMKNIPAAMRPNFKPDWSLQDLWDEDNAKLCSHGFPYSNSDEICGCKLNQEPTVKEYPCKCDCHNKMTKEELYPDNRPITNCGLCCLDEPIDKSEKIEEIISGFYRMFPKEKIDRLSPLFEQVNKQTHNERLVSFESWLRDKLKDICK